MQKIATARTPEEQERYASFTQAQLRAHWKDKYEDNLNIIDKYISTKLTEQEREVMTEHKNADGFPMGADPRYICRLLELAEKALTAKQKHSAKLDGPYAKKNSSIN